MLRKKSNLIMDSSKLGITIFMFCLIALVSVLILKNFNDVTQSNSSMTNESKDGVGRAYSAIKGGFNWGAVILYLGLLVGSVIGARLVDFSFGKVILGILFLAFIVISLIVPNNAYETLRSANSDVSELTSDMSMLDYFGLHLVELGIIYFTIVSIAMFTRSDKP